MDLFFAVIWSFLLIADLICWITGAEPNWGLAIAPCFTVVYLYWDKWWSNRK